MSNSNVNNVNLANNVTVFSFDNTGQLTLQATVPLTPAVNPQPQSLAMDPAGKFLFTANMTSDNIFGIHRERRCGYSGGGLAILCACAPEPGAMLAAVPGDRSHGIVPLRGQRQ